MARDGAESLTQAACRPEPTRGRGRLHGAVARGSGPLFGPDSGNICSIMFRCVPFRSWDVGGMGLERCTNGTRLEPEWNKVEHLWNTVQVRNLDAGEWQARCLRSRRDVCGLTHAFILARSFAEGKWWVGESFLAWGLGASARIGGRTDLCHAPHSSPSTCSIART